MKNDLKMGKQLIDELVELWIETKIRCDKIEELVKQIKERSEEQVVVGF